jgi:hypothetical protein
MGTDRTRNKEQITKRAPSPHFLVLLISASWFPLFATPCSLFPVPYSLFPIPCSLFPVPYSLLFPGGQE